MKDDGTLVAATLPDEAVEPGVVRATSDLVRGVEAFRDQRYDEAKRLLTRAALDKQQAALAGALFTRVNGAFGSASLARTSPAAKQAATTTLQTLRDTAEGLAKAGMTRIALALDEGTDRLGAQVPGLTVPATKVDRADLTKRAAISQRETMLARQSFALKQLVAASKHVAAGLEAALESRLSAGMVLSLPAADRSLDRDAGMVPSRSIASLIRSTARHHGIAAEVLIGHGRQQCVVRIRSVAMYLARRLTIHSLEEIGKAFGGRQHTTVMRSVRSVDEWIRADHGFAQDVEKIVGELRAPRLRRRRHPAG